jgi:imidazole glycerol-phosphate synthase subunit HisH
MIAIVDYGMGNIGSVKNMLTYLGFKSEIVETEKQITNASKLILPGVGAFNKAMEQIEQRGIKPALIQAATINKVPILGICLGMQLLLGHSEEGDADGLNLIAGSVKKISVPNSKLKVPHMGWNNVETTSQHPLFKDMPTQNRFYFVHSYYAHAESTSNVIGNTQYGITFHSAIANDNVIGVQFHPEKSHVFGMKLMRNFGNL